MNVVVPMAGRGARFAERGVQTPKPLIEVAGRPMLYWALQSLAGVDYSRIIFVALKQHEDEFGVSNIINQCITSPFELILLEDVTEGQLCTVLAARECIDNHDGVLITSADTYVVSNIGADIAALQQEVKGLISVGEMPGERWSFARTDATGKVVEVAEKIRISEHASTGLYYFSNGREFISIADQIIAAQEKTRGEYYVIPVYQKYIERGWIVELSKASEIHDMGTPDALRDFLSHLP